MLTRVTSEPTRTAIRARARDRVMSRVKVRVRVTGEPTSTAIRARSKEG